MIEYFLFCADERPVEIAELSDVLRQAGWNLRVVRNLWAEAGDLQLVEQGPLEDSHITLGWTSDFREATNIEKAILDSDRKSLEEWSLEWQLGLVNWMIRPNFDLAKHSEFGSLENAREQMGDVYADHLAITKQQLIAFNCPELEFASTIMGAVVMLRRGIIEDPQMALCIPAPKNVAELASYLDKLDG